MGVGCATLLLSNLCALQVFWIGFSVIGGVVFYQQGTVSLVGVLLMILGVSFLVQHGRQTTELERGLRENLVDRGCDSDGGGVYGSTGGSTHRDKVIRGFSSPSIVSPHVHII